MPPRNRAALIIASITAGVVLLAGVVGGTLYLSHPAPPVAPVSVAAPTTTTAATTAQAAPPVVVIPAPAQPSTVTQYYPQPSYPPYYSPSPYDSSSSDADFLSRMRARDIVTPGDEAEIAGAHQVCANLAHGSGITAEANNMMDSPFNYSASLAGYFAGESVKIYCPEFSSQLSPG